MGNSPYRDLTNSETIEIIGIEAWNNLKVSLEKFGFKQVDFRLFSDIVLSRFERMPAGLIECLYHGFSPDLGQKIDSELFISILAVLRSKERTHITKFIFRIYESRSNLWERKQVESILQMAYGDTIRQYLPGLIEQLNLIFERGKDEATYKDFEAYAGRLDAFTKWIRIVLKCFLEPIPIRLHELHKKYSTHLDVEELSKTLSMAPNTLEHIRRIYYKKCSFAAKAEMSIDVWLRWVCGTLYLNNVNSYTTQETPVTASHINYLSVELATVLFQWKIQVYKPVWRLTDFIDFCIQFGMKSLELQINILCDAFINYECTQSWNKMKKVEIDEDNEFDSDCKDIVEKDTSKGWKGAHHSIPALDIIESALRKMLLILLISSEPQHSAWKEVHSTATPLSSSSKKQHQLLLPIQSKASTNYLPENRLLSAISSTNSLQSSLNHTSSPFSSIHDNLCRADQMNNSNSSSNHNILEWDLIQLKQFPYDKSLTVSDGLIHDIGLFDQLISQLIPSNESVPPNGILGYPISNPTTTDMSELSDTQREKMNADNAQHNRNVLVDFIRELLVNHSTQFPGLRDLSLTANSLFGVPPLLPWKENEFVTELTLRHMIRYPQSPSEPHGPNGTEWCIISKVWMERWRFYVGQKHESVLKPTTIVHPNEEMDLKRNMRSEGNEAVRPSAIKALSVFNILTESTIQQNNQIKSMKYLHKVQPTGSHSVTSAGKPPSKPSAIDNWILLQQLPEALQTSNNPSLASNPELIKEYHRSHNINKQLQKDLRLGIDMEAIPVIVFDTLVAWYGGGPKIIRKVIDLELSQEPFSPRASSDPSLLINRHRIHVGNSKIHSIPTNGTSHSIPTPTSLLTASTTNMMLSRVPMSRSSSSQRHSNNDGNHLEHVSNPKPSVASGTGLPPISRPISRNNSFDLILSLADTEHETMKELSKSHSRSSKSTHDSHGVDTSGDHESDGKATVPTPHSPVIRAELELFPYSLKVCLCDKKGNLITNPTMHKEFLFSRNATIQDITVELCHFHRVETSRVRLWNCAADNLRDQYIFSPELQLHTATINDRQWVLMEISLEDGTWPRSQLHANFDMEDQVLTKKSTAKLLGGKVMEEGFTATVEGEDGTDEPTSKEKDSIPSKKQQRQLLARLRKNNGLIGLDNLGNTCYLNSSLQALLHTEPLVDYFLSHAYLKDVNLHNKHGFKGRLAHSFGRLCIDAWTVQRNCFPPKLFYHDIAAIRPQFAGHEQHDAHELLAFLLEGLSEDLNLILDKPYIQQPDSDDRLDHELADIWWHNHLKRECSVIQGLFTGQFKSKICCTHCSYQSARFEPFNFLTVPIPEETFRVLFVLVVPWELHKIVQCAVRVHRVDGTVQDIINQIRDLQLDGVQRLTSDHLEWSNRSIPLANEFHFLGAELVNNRIKAFNTPDRKVDEVRDTDQLIFFQVRTPTIIKASIIPDVTATGPIDSINKMNYEQPSLDESIDIQTVNQQAAPPLYPPLSFDRTVRVAFCQRRAKYLSGNMMNAAGFDTFRIETFGFPILEVMPNRIYVKELYRIIYQRVKVFLKASIRGLRRHMELASTALQVTKYPLKNGLSDGIPLQENPLENSKEMKGLPVVVRSIDSDQLLTGPIPKYGFFLRLVNGGTNTFSSCPYCHWTDRCAGCVIPLPSDPSSTTRVSNQPIDKKRPNASLRQKDNPLNDKSGGGGGEVVELKDGESIAIDWHYIVFEDLLDVSLASRIQRHESITTESALKSDKKIPLYDCLDKFVDKEKLDMVCPKCKQGDGMIQSLSIWRPPPILVVQLKRFQFDHVTRKKLQNRIDIPLNGLDIGKYLTVIDKSGSQEDELHPGVSSHYDLYAVIHHIGAMGGGHYVTTARKLEKYHNPVQQISSLPVTQPPPHTGFALRAISQTSLNEVYSPDADSYDHNLNSQSADSTKKPLNSLDLSSEEDNGVWYCFNDNLVSRVKHPHEITAPSAYVLFYMRRDIRGTMVTDLLLQLSKHSVNGIDPSVHELAGKQWQHDFVKALTSQFNHPPSNVHHANGMKKPLKLSNHRNQSSISHKKSRENEDNKDFSMNIDDHEDDGDDPPSSTTDPSCIIS